MHMKYLGYVAYFWHLRGIFVVGTYVFMEWKIKVAVWYFIYFLTCVCNISKPISVVTLLHYIHYACTKLLMLFAHA